ncbi:MAG: hypothetical protein LKJ80_00720 [Oscillibacter sp.]|jgi:hypothetical protein|nr:hypothetical protein [Oscillibacter sp.]
MDFPEKLKFLMELTATSNIQLSQLLKVDPSLISRYKSGTRSVPEQSNYIHMLSVYFASKCNTNYKHTAVLEMAGINEKGPLSGVLEKWLSNAPPDSPRKIWKRSEALREKRSLPSGFGTALGARMFKSEGCSFSGPHSKEEALRLFFELAAADGYPADLKLLTQEDPDWLRRDPEYSACVNLRLQQLLATGRKVIRVIPEFVNLKNALDSAQRWMPLYCTRKVKTFYYHGVRDNLINHTLYVMPGVAALFSCSSGIANSTGPVFVTTDPELVASFEALIDDYLSFCTPVSTYYDYPGKSPGMKQVLDDFFDYPADCILISDTLPLSSSPPELLPPPTFKSRGCGQIRDFCEKRYTALVNLLPEHTVIEVFPLHTFEDIVSGRAVFMARSMFCHSEVGYTPGQYVLHLSNILYLLNTYPNFHIYLHQDSDVPSSIYIKRSHELLILNHQEQQAMCKITHPDLVGALWEYEYSAVKRSILSGIYREESISKIKQLIRRLRSYCKSHPEL